MRIGPEPGIDEMAALTAPERPKPYAVLVRLDIRKDLGDNHSSALRACHPVSFLHLKRCANVTLLSGCRGEGLSGGGRPI